jgi:hypothetical protein
MMVPDDDGDDEGSLMKVGVVALFDSDGAPKKKNQAVLITVMVDDVGCSQKISTRPE